MRSGMSSARLSKRPYSQMGNEAILLTGGLGTRLRGISGDLPKTMLPVAGRPFLEHVVSSLVVQGFTRIVLAVGYKREKIREHFGSDFNNTELIYSEEDTPLGTGGAVRRALKHVRGENVFVLNSDTWCQIDYSAMLHAHMTERSLLTMAVVTVEDIKRFGSVAIEAGRVLTFQEKGASGPGLINAGVYAMAVDHLASAALPASFSLEREYIEPRIAELRPLAFPIQGTFIDIGVPADYERAQSILGIRGAT